MFSRRCKGDYFIAMFSILVLFFTLTNCHEAPPPPETRQRVVLIFSDVTSSLVQSESERVATLTSNIIDSLLPGTRYFIYPVQVEGQKLEPMDEGTIPIPDPALADAVKKDREDKLNQKIAELYNLIKSVKQPSGTGKADNHTCIVDTLKVAQNRFKDFDRKQTDFELIYVSDMIEECNETPMGKPISLVKTTMSEAIKLAQATDLKLDLSYANVSMIIPVTNDTYTTRGRPNLTDLRNFWEAVLLHCGFSKENLSSNESNEKFYFGAGLPHKFQSQQN